MREKLSPYLGIRTRYTARVYAFGEKLSFRNYNSSKLVELQTICLIDVMHHATKQPLCDHVWFTITPRWRKLKLAPGDIITFDAKAIKYVKGYVELNGVNNRHIDYKLVVPTAFAVLRVHEQASYGLRTA